MPRLTRTQKYADLRDKLANEVETSATTQDLSKFEDRLNTLQSLSSPVAKEETKVVEEVKVEEPVTVIPEVKEVLSGETTISAPDNSFFEEKEEVKDDISFTTDSIMSLFDSLEEFSNKEEEIKEETVTAEPVTEEVKIEEPVVEETVKEEEPKVESISDLDDFFSMLMPVDAVEETEEEKPVVIENPAVDSVAEETAEISDDEALNDIFEVLETSRDTEETKQEETVEEPVEETVVEEAEEETELIAEEPVKENEIDESETAAYMNETLKEVETWNQSEGNMTVEELSSAIVDEVRHGVKEEEPETAAVKEEAVVEETEESEDDEVFSSTISLEVSKIMGEMEAESKAEEAAKVTEEVKEAVKEETKKDDIPEFARAYFEDTAPTEEHPVLAKELEKEDDGLEIKNYSEIDDIETTSSKTISDTIPFIVSNQDNDDLYEEDGAPNKILNVILAILIIVLVAVLGLIVYYILLARGIL